MATKKKSILSLSDVTFTYSNQVVLESINFSMTANECVAIIGPNGGGKSTLLKLIMGLEKPTVGHVSLFGTSVQKGRRKVGYLSQFQTMRDDFPVYALDAVLTSTLQRGVFYKNKAKDIKKAHDKLDLLQVGDLANKPINELSGGQRQRVFLARALMTEPELLILDEPTCSIDSASEAQFYETIAELQKEMAILIVTHDLSGMAKTVDRIACLNKHLIYHDKHDVSTDTLTSHGHGGCC